MVINFGIFYFPNVKIIENKVISHETERKELSVYRCFMTTCTFLSIWCTKRRKWCTKKQIWCTKNTIWCTFFLKGAPNDEKGARFEVGGFSFLGNEIIRGKKQETFSEILK